MIVREIRMPRMTIATVWMTTATVRWTRTLSGFRELWYRGLLGQGNNPLVDGEVVKNCTPLEPQGPDSNCNGPTTTVMGKRTRTTSPRWSRVVSVKWDRDDELCGG